LIAEEETFVAFGVDEEGHFGEVAGGEFAGGKVADLVVVRRGMVEGQVGRLTKVPSTVGPYLEGVVSLC
jgi:hypothetical protein